jgi:hypothetical protein
MACIVDPTVGAGVCAHVQGLQPAGMHVCGWGGGGGGLQQHAAEQAAGARHLN